MLLYNSKILTSRHSLYNPLVKFREWLQNNTNGSVLLSDVTCKQNDDKVADCNAQVLEHSCDYEQRVWLNCSDGKGNNQYNMYKCLPLISLRKHLDIFRPISNKN